MSNSVTIYHNPDCGTSRNTLALIRACGIEPTIVEYLKNPPDRATLVSLIARMGLGVRPVLRVKGTPYSNLGLDAPGLDDATLIDHMLLHPILINRPIVETAAGVRLCRPSDLVMELLPVAPSAELCKADGSPVLLARPQPAGDTAFVNELQAAGLATDDLDEPGRRFLAFSTTEGRTVGYGGYELHGEHMLLRSVLVPPAARGRGIGAGIVALLLRRAFDEGARTAWLLTAGPSAFFVHCGFSAIARSTAPEPILSTRQAASLCPDSATLMTRAIAP